VTSKSDIQYEHSCAGTKVYSHRFLGPFSETSMLFQLMLSFACPIPALCFNLQLLGFATLALGWRLLFKLIMGAAPLYDEVVGLEGGTVQTGIGSIQSLRLATKSGTCISSSIICSQWQIISPIGELKIDFV